MSNYTPLFKSPDDLLLKAERELWRMRASARKCDLEGEADCAFNLAITLWQMTDWIWKSDLSHIQNLKLAAGSENKMHKKAFLGSLFNKCPELEICSEIADGSKHFLLDHKKENKKVVERVLVSAPRTVEGKVNPSVLKVELKNGERISAEATFKNVLNFWKKILKPD